MFYAINVSLVVGLLALAGVANPALAAEPPEPDREIRAAVYGWAAAAHGPLRVRGNEA